MKVKPVQEIEQALAAVAQEVGVEIYAVEFRQGRNPSLTVYLDTPREGGIDLDTCEKFHNAADPVLDELDPTYGQPYTLNVSSPGLDRPFRKPSDFERNMNKRWKSSCMRPARARNFSKRCCAGMIPWAGTSRWKRGRKCLSSTSPRS